jgi:hypothetical protein
VVVLGSGQNNKKTKGKGKASGGARRGKELGFPMGFGGGLKWEEEKGVMLSTWCVGDVSEHAPLILHL